MYIFRNYASALRWRKAPRENQTILETIQWCFQLLLWYYYPSPLIVRGDLCSKKLLHDIDYDRSTKKKCLKNARTKCLWLLNRFKLKKTIISITILVSENWATAGKITRQPQWRQLKLTSKAPLILYEQFNCWFCLRSR